MPRFVYKAKSRSAEIVSGEIEAATLREALEKLSIQGQIPIDVHPCKPGPWPKSLERRAHPWEAAFFGRRIAFKDVCDLTRRMFDLVDAGVPILRSMEILGRGISHAGLKAIVEALARSLQGGESLSVSLSKYPEVFPAFYIHMVRSGEASGNLAGALSRLVDLMERDLKLRGKVMASLAYPGIVLAVGILTFFVLLTVVMPKLMVLFEDFDMTLPLLTQVVMAASSFLASFWWAVLAAFSAGAIFLYRSLQSEAGKQMADGMVLRIALLKDFIRQSEIARMSRALAVLLEGGVPITIAMETVAGLASNAVIKDELKQVARDVKGGQSFTVALKTHASCWPEAASSMVAVGEESGKLDTALYKLAVVMERETETSSGIFVTLLGPLVLFLVVGAIGTMILAVLLPLFQMNMMVK